MAENAEQISQTLVLDYIKKKDPALGMKISKKWNAPELPPGSPDVKEIVEHFMKTTKKKRRESLELLTPAKKSKCDESTPKTNGATNGSAKSGKSNGHAKGSESSSEESSEEDEKPVVAKKTPSKSLKVVRPTAPVQQDSSEESSSEEEEKPAAKKVVPPKTTPKQAPKKETSSEEDSSDDEPKMPKVQAPKVVAKVVAKKESSSSEEDSSEEELPKKQTKSPKVTKPLTKKESSSDDSSDDEEPSKPKVVPKQTPKVPAKPAAKESSDDSDSSEESDEKANKKALVKKVVPTKALAKAASSSSDEESSDDEKAKKPVAKKAPAKPAAKKESSDEDSSSDEEEPPKKVVKKSTKKESSSSEESDSDDEETAKPAPPAAREKRKRESESGAEFGKQQKFIKADTALNGDSAEGESCELFVNRIGSSMTDDQLYEHFKQFGSIERTKIVTDRDTGESRGFAFVTFSSPAEAKAALSNGFSHMIDGTECQVRLSEPKPMAGGQQKFGGNNSFGGGNNSFGASDSGESKELFVNRLDFSFTDDHLYEHFKQFGTVERARVATDRETGDSRGFAFITFATHEEAKAAAAKSHSIEGSEFSVRLAEPKGSDGGRQQFTAPQSTQRRKSEPFRRVREEEVVVDPKFTNAFTAKRGAEDDWGFRAHRDLIKTRGKGFRHEKNKKKKGSYSGGTISTAVTSIKFD